MKYDVLLMACNLGNNFPSPSIAILKSILNRDTGYKSKAIDLAMYNVPVTNTTSLSDRPFSSVFRPVNEFECMPVFVGIKNSWNKHNKINFNFLKEKAFKNYLLRNGITIDNFISELENFKQLVTNILNSHDFSSIGISVYGMSLLQAEIISLLVREKDPLIPIIVGGPNIIQSQFTRNIFLKGGFADIAVYGEGEVCISRLIESLLSNKENDLKKIDNLCYYKNKTIIKTNKSAITNLDSLPIADYSDIDLNKYESTLPKLFIYWSRGCNRRCKFCNEWNLYSNKLRFKSPEYAVNEIEQLKKKYNTILFGLGDSLIDFSDEWMDKFCSLVEERNLKFIWYGQMTCRQKPLELLKRMRKNGLIKVHAGLESIDPTIYNKMKKGHKSQQYVKESIKRLSKAGINVGLYLISSYEGETDEIYLNTLNQIYDFQKENPSTYIAVVSPSTLMPNSIDYLNPSEKMITFKEAYPEFHKYIPQDIFDDVENTPMKFESSNISTATAYNRWQNFSILSYKIKKSYDQNSPFFFDLETDFELFKDYFIKLKPPIKILDFSPINIELQEGVNAKLNKNELDVLFNISGKKRIIEYLEKKYKTNIKKQKDFFRDFFMHLIRSERVQLRKKIFN